MTNADELVRTDRSDEVSRSQRTAVSPLIDLQPFRSVPFSVTLAMMIITAMLMGGTILFVSLWLRPGRRSPAAATVATVGAVLVLSVTALCAATIARSAYAPEPEFQPTADPAA